ncbi:MAG: hypothetical protein HWN81_19370 [Candidatus Lokiarchaeota archaeon]|nr:hypothetical protein [Candidatus Lokiarchaeota archaeon]
MQKELWKYFNGEVGENVKSDYDALELFWPYVKDDKQGEMLYNVRGDFQNGILYMTCQYDGKTAYGRIDSPIESPKMVDRAFGMDKDDAVFCGWLSDMILSTQFEGCTEEQILESWQNDF